MIKINVCFSVRTTTKGLGLKSEDFGGVVGLVLGCFLFRLKEKKVFKQFCYSTPSSGQKWYLLSSL